MVLFPQPAARRYVSCPRCGSPHAFVTLERTETQCSFCPLCRYLWDTLRERWASPKSLTGSTDTARYSQGAEEW